METLISLHKLTCMYHAFHFFSNMIFSHYMQGVSIVREKHIPGGCSHGWMDRRMDGCQSGLHSFVLIQNFCLQSYKLLIAHYTKDRVVFVPLSLCFTDFTKQLMLKWQCSSICLLCSNTLSIVWCLWKQVANSFDHSWIFNT